MKNKQQLAWIKRKLRGQDNSLYFLNPTKIVGNVLITLSGLLLYLDKVLVFLNIKIPVPTYYKNIEFDQETFIWFVTQSLTPILLIIAVWFRANKLFYIIPLFCYVLQLHFNLFDYKLIDNDYLYAYAIGTTIITVLVVLLIKVLAAKHVKRIFQKEKERIKNGLQKNQATN